MKKIEAIFKEEHLDDIKDALEAAGFLGLTVYPVRGRGRQGGIELQWRAGPYKVDLLHKVMLMVVVPDKAVDAVVAIIRKACQVDAAAGGAGRIFITHVEQAIHIGSGEVERDE